MSFVFLSHASANNAQALALAQWLEGNGWADYFLDISETRGLIPGSQWQNEFSAQIRLSSLRSGGLSRLACVA